MKISRITRGGRTPAAKLDADGNYPATRSWSDPATDPDFPALFALGLRDADGWTTR